MKLGRCIDCANWLADEQYCTENIGGVGVVWGTGRRELVIDPEQEHWCAGFIARQGQSVGEKTAAVVY